MFWSDTIKYYFAQVLVYFCPIFPYFVDSLIFIKFFIKFSIIQLEDAGKCH